MADKIKFLLALLLLVAGVVGFYYFTDVAAIWRVLGFLAGLALSVLVAWKTEPGRRFFEFTREAIAETKKVVWPSRKETMQLTGVVFAFVVIMAIFLWLTDKTVEWALYDLILGWKT
ncbi:MAG: preprotein translocase subunit SecE [Betaproteobacteria bacterium]|nr:preprotein translocase subunit SecE [Betaproteobacteria bacterium]